ncbi:MULTISPECIES: DUF4197 domain-containing protein [Roseivirga]|uniref:DUF4197 domain-containing protein n=1 Tax=Roseivirga spongicola TaxID=333140 RepID=A0A150X6A6_9BACT|nr:MULTISPECIES: DUF4197 domain-containing protein [Roseivirga]KYG74224.1 hypothetical protein AWW68_16380 [Roseivirga spongicola]MBO6495214.1 DUF4197 domain-containing protein [Roseivirga sp.]WPZ09110.1 DUF4197 domain-containing protein [Roseivirga spongicola]
MRNLYFVLMSLLVMSCSSQAQILQKAKGLLGGDAAFTKEEAANALKQALEQGTVKGVSVVSQVDGYLKNPEIKIPFPPEAENVEQKLRAIGLGNQVDEAVESLNRAAEDAASEAKDIFITAIKALTIQDAINIVKGEQDAATRFLERTTTAELTAKFSPIINSSLQKVNATKYWGDVMGTYNKIPFVKKVETDLTAYVTQKAIDGLFVMIANEELNIRQNPAARTTELLKKVFK